MTKIFANAFLVLTTVFMLSAQVLEKGNSSIEVKGIENINGQIILTLYTDPEGFPAKPDIAFKKYVIPIRDLTVEALLENLPYSEYAIGLFHDENLDGELNTNFYGIPKEKAGASNTPKTLLIPSFAKTKFELLQKSITKNIKIN